MTKSTWKSVERTLARRLRCERIPVSDARSGADIISQFLSGEVKHRKRLPDWLKSAAAQATAAARDHQLPIAILHECNARHDTDLVLMSLSTFERMLLCYESIEYFRITRPCDYERIFLQNGKFSENFGNE